jgi:hypothetical protein
MEIMEPKEAWGRLHTQEVAGSSPAAPTIFQQLTVPRGTRLVSFAERIRHGFDGLTPPVEIRMGIKQCHPHIAAHLGVPA